LNARQIKPGIEINNSNYEKYLPELKELLSPIVYSHYINGIKNGRVTMPVVEKGQYLAPDGYLKWSEKNRGKYKAGEKNRLVGPVWHGGAPFPEPSNGTELGWNIYYRYSCTREEFQLHNDFHLYNKRGKRERTISNYFYGKLYNGRANIPPIPEIPGNNGIIHWKVAMLVIDPFDIRGFIMLRVNYEDIFKPDDVYCYVPALRRLRRLTGADVTDPLLGSDCCYDDFECWQQKLGPDIVFHNPVEKDMLVSKQVDLYKYPRRMQGWLKGDCFQSDWELRQLWLLPADMNDPDYNYSKRLFYIEKDDRSFFIHGIDNYDKKGRLWKCVSAFGITNQPDTRLRTWHGGLYKDHITGHTTLSDLDPIDPELDKVRIPLDYFTIKVLLRKSR
ncbi:MAG: DUF1329 domain-containing protein, partial [Thermodesulfobacteriota bacterium]|nr:DUF1329 domain-containing protein [Thermodesulfobacteriota bacterium]